MYTNRDNFEDLNFYLTYSVCSFIADIIRMRSDIGNSYNDKAHIKN